MKFLVGRNVYLNDLPQGKRIKIREHKIVPNIEAFRCAMKFLEAEEIEIKQIKESSEGDVIYVATNEHLVVIVEVLPDDDDGF